MNQIVMKLGDWRRNSYPLRIWIDDKEVWTGKTEKGLGYVHISFEPTEGKKVRMALQGAVEDADVFDNIVEVTGKKLEDSKTGAKGELVILEAEIYEPLAGSAP